MNSLKIATRETSLCLKLPQRQCGYSAMIALEMRDGYRSSQLESYCVAVGLAKDKCLASRHKYDLVEWKALIHPNLANA